MFWCPNESKISRIHIECGVDDTSDLLKSIVEITVSVKQDHVFA